ncbi:MAG: hypothetical protein J2P36_25715 [Ktedonobacteraceae bacterium]|nr:hypothetical protein [Ktedonobacteraceae bacterium]
MLADPDGIFIMPEGLPPVEEGDEKEEEEDETYCYPVDNKAIRPGDEYYCIPVLPL